MLVLAPRGDGSSRHRTMARTRRSLVALALIAITTSVGTAQPSAGTTGELHLDNLSGLQLQGVRADIVTYRGRRAVHLLEQPGVGTADWKAPGEAMAIIIGSDFTDGVIEAELSGAPKAGAAEGSRGFVGVAFRVPPGGSSFECFYLRPTNGRAADQLRRTIPRNTSRSPITHGSGCGRRLPECTNPTWTWSLECGPRSGSSSRGRKRGCT